ncbi:MAG: VF530 family protein [Candidatus Gracilibacteria bacterium]|nr:VF530 family protein [Candidatus Gracilibacteria bacterium]
MTTYSKKANDILHGVSLAKIMEYLVEVYGFEELSELVRINCFKNNPSIQSSLKFLRKTLWAREQVEGLYVRTRLEKMDEEKWGKDF